MGKSRLEKFLYALYSLDSSDLPTPLSRIEELYKCWATGEEVPTFKPLSRVEKYLMAILGTYDVELLPNPLSMVEVLLYKLATGDDNLDDVEIFLSKHEELLAEIIRNGGAGGNIDIEYVLYTLSTEHNTLYNTAKKPVKSAILKGDTLVNYAQITSYNFDEYRTPVHDLNKSLEKGKIYTIIMNIVSQTVTYGVAVRFAKDRAGYVGLELFNGVGLHKQLFTATDDFNQFAPYIDNGEYQTGLRAEYNQLMILEGDYTSVDIPFFEGTQSVKMPVLTVTGKNVMESFFNKTFTPNSATVSYEYTDREITVSSTDAGWRRVLVGDFGVIPGKTYTLSFDCEVMSEDPHVDITIIGENGNKYLYGEIIQKYDQKRERAYELNIRPEDSKIAIGFYSSNDVKFGKIRYYNIQLEEGSIATSYEPHKSTTITCNEEVELRGIGDVQDELNLLTGELTQRIGEVVLDGSEDWIGDWIGEPNTSNQNKTISAYVLRIIDTNQTNSTNIICERFQSKNVNMIDEEGIYIHGSKGFRLRISKDKLSSLDINGFKTYLQSNPLTVQYPTTESNKTVDLSVVNQDGNDTKLSTFNDITHVTLSSEELIPEAELEVATKNEEVLNTMSLEMDDISTTQNALKEASNTQSENVDSTMLATTEIYEQLL